MKTWKMSVGAILLFVSASLCAQQDISGTWSGQLPVSKSSKLEVHFILTHQPDGSYKAVLTSPDQGGIKNVPANTVEFKDGHLKITVDALSGSYDGMLQNGKFDGQWHQPGSVLPLELSPYTAPVLSDAAKKELMGQWNGKLTSPVGALAIVFRFEKGTGGKFVGFLDSPDQGAKGIPIGDIELADKKLKLTVPRARGEYTATFDGQRMVGTWKQGGQGLPLVMNKGEYKPASKGLGLSAAAASTLKGSWRGKLGRLTLVVRFEQDKDGHLVGFLDSPDQHAKGIPVTSATFSGGKLDARVTGVGGRLQADVKGDTMSGQWTQAGRSLPLTLTKD